MRRELLGKGLVRVEIRSAGREIYAFCLTAWMLPPGEGRFLNYHLEWQGTQVLVGEPVLEHGAAG